ncbi:MAG: hypothetical protein OXE78_11200 [Gammaproteobacteria bacterium]|nr:hypothetical protein [Gammaproteobacteria bacterium]
MKLVEEQSWPNGSVCPSCDEIGNIAHRVKATPCKSCLKDFSENCLVVAGTHTRACKLGDQMLSNMVELDESYFGGKEVKQHNEKNANAG